MWQAPQQQVLNCGTVEFPLFVCLPEGLLFCRVAGFYLLIHGARNVCRFFAGGCQLALCTGQRQQC
jgi:hypothetical protein